MENVAQLQPSCERCFLGAINPDVFYGCPVFVFVFVALRNDSQSVQTVSAHINLDIFYGAMMKGAFLSSFSKNETF